MYHNNVINTQASDFRYFFSIHVYLLSLVKMGINTVSKWHIQYSSFLYLWRVTLFMFIRTRATNNPTYEPQVCTYLFEMLTHSSCKINCNCLITYQSQQGQLQIRPQCWYMALLRSFILSLSLILGCSCYCQTLQWWDFYIQGSHTSRKLGNIREFDNYVQGPGNTRECFLICGKPGKLLEFKHFFPPLQKTKQSSYYACFLCIDPAG